MSENGVEIIHIPDDKENVLKSKKAATVNNNNIIPKNEKSTEKTKQAGENLFSPPRKKLKQESLPFPVIPKDEALEKLNNSIAEEKAAQVSENVTKVNGEESNCTKENESKEQSTDKKSTTPNPIKKTAKSPGLSKEEKERQRLEREQLKLEKQKEIEEKKRLKDEEKKKKEEEKKKREEERLQKQAEKEKKEQERKIEKEKKEQERKEKEKLKEEDRKKKEEGKKKRDEQRENERREKEAEREKKEQEKKMEEEKKKMKEEAEKKKKEKAANQFKSFFTKKTTEKKTVEKPAKISRFANFQVTPNMTLAPCVRVRNFDKSKIDSFLEKDIADFSSYLEELAIKIANNQLPPCVTRRKLRKEEETKRKTEFETKTAQNTEKKDFEPKTKRRKSSSGLDQSMNSTDCVIINDDSNSNDNSSDDEDDNETSFVEDKQLMKAIYLKFDENTRPPYYGTWRKKSRNISGRKPFGQDTEIFNYDVDSDEEWIDEPGEDCSDNGEDDDEDVKETEEDQDGFFVPHGYLSDDEGVPDDDEDEENEENESEKLPVPKDIADAKREQDKLKSKVDSFEVAFKKKLKPRKPICIGIKFTNNIEDADPLLKDFYKISLHKSHGDLEANENEDQDGTPKKTGIEASGEVNNGSSVPLTVPEEAMPFLLKLVHGNATSIGKMIQEFQTYWVEYVKINGLDNLRKTISKKQCIKKMKEIATKGPNEKLGKICYTVNVDILQKYGIADLELGCGLTYPVLKETMLLSNGAKENGADTTETVVNGDCIMLDTSKTEDGNLQNQNVDKIPNDVSIPAENKMEVD